MRFGIKVKTWRGKTGIIIGKGKYYIKRLDGYGVESVYIIQLDTPYVFDQKQDTDGKLKDISDITGYLSHNYLGIVVELKHCVEIL